MHTKSILKRVVCTYQGTKVHMFSMVVSYMTKNTPEFRERVLIGIYWNLRMAHPSLAHMAIMYSLFGF